MKHVLGAADVGVDGEARLLEDRLDAHGRGKVDHRIATFDELLNKRSVTHRANYDLKVPMVLDRSQIIERTGRKVV